MKTMNNAVRIVIHENCRVRYNDAKNIQKAAASISISELDSVVDSMSVCSDMDRDIDISSISSSIANNVPTNIGEDKLQDADVFKWSNNCFICAKQLNTGKGRKKFVKYHKISKKSDVRETILNLCKNRSDDIANAVSMRIASVDLFGVGAGYHRQCMLLFTKNVQCIGKQRDVVTTTNVDEIKKEDINVNNLEEPNTSVGIANVDFTSQFCVHDVNTNNVNEIENADVQSSKLAEYSVIPQWTVDNCGQSNNHQIYLKNVAIRNGMEFLNTIGGGSCFFDAVRQCLIPYGMTRTIPQLRMAAALELEIHADDYRPLYALEDHGQGEQATTYEEFIRRTKYEMEWATAMTVAALARSLDVCIAVIANKYQT